MFWTGPQPNDNPLTKVQLMDTPPQKKLTQGNLCVLPHRNTV